MYQVKIPKKLIEVALPLDDINAAASREKSIRHGHHSTLHLWWARRPSAAARAVLFAQMVNDPGYERHLGRGVNKAKAVAERERLFEIIRKLVLWENTNDEEILKEAREEIWKSWRETCALNKDHPQAPALFNPDKLPVFYDPFAGGGTIPLEAQRLGLEAYASDLNPVAVTINKAMIEIPPKFVGRSPVGPRPTGETQVRFQDEWIGTKGLAEDVRRYGAWMRDEAYKRIGHAYPQVDITKEMAKDRPDLKSMVGHKLTIAAWLWARTVKSPNPAFAHAAVPLISSFVLSSKDKHGAWMEVFVKEDKYRFVVKVGDYPKDAEKGTKLARGANFRCILSDSPMTSDYIRGEFRAKRNSVCLMAVIAEHASKLVYLSPTLEMEQYAQQAQPAWRPEQEMNQETSDLVSGRGYGIKYWYEIFTTRQILALVTFHDLVKEVREKIRRDAVAAGFINDNAGLEAGGVGAQAYAEAVSVYLSFAVDKCADYWNTIATWMPRGTVGHAFSKQALPMTWDFPEANPFANFHCAWHEAYEWVAKSIEMLPRSGFGIARQEDASSQHLLNASLISTDPPYYDNIAYSDLSDFFYVWLRHSLRAVFPDLYATLTVPKTEELVAATYRHGSKEKAETFFLDGMTQAMHRLAEQAHPAFPVTIYYAFRQSETDSDEGTASAGWETFLNAVFRAGFVLSGTWPMRTERSARSIAMDTNALASSIILVCRKRSIQAQTISRREFVRELNAVLPEALIEMTCGGEHSPVAPVDLSQAIIGPGMEIFSKYSAVLEADGKPMTVRTALQLINRFLAEDDFDHDTQFCLHWFETEGWGSGKYGDADVLARAKGTGVDGLKDAGVLESGSGQVRLLKWSEYPQDWNPIKDKRTPIWEALHHMIRVLSHGGESESGALLGYMINRGEAIRQLAYRLYTLCERKGWAEDARAYNELINSWSAIEAVAGKSQKVDTQIDLFK